MADGRTSYTKQVIAGIVIALAAGGSAPWWLSALLNHNDGTGGGGGGGGGHVVENQTCGNASISLSQGSGPSGTQIVITGTGFPSNEAVDVIFSTEALAPARTDDQGGFRDEVVVPGTFDAFAPQQFSITATTKPTVCFDDAPFQLTSS